MTGSAPAHRLDLRLREMAQLFNSMDPAPFLERDLDPDAEEYIESWAMAFPPDSRFHLTLHLQQQPAQADPERTISEAVHNFFNFKAELARRDLRRLLREGRTSLLIGLCFLVACLIAADAVSRNAGGSMLALGRESLTIIGWVAMWRPIDTFLYDWWPLWRRRRIYQSLGRSRVSLAIPQKAEASGAAAPG